MDVNAHTLTLRTARAAPERTSMGMFPSIAYCTAKKKGRWTRITRLLKRNQHETDTSTAWPTNHEHSEAAGTAASVRPTALEQHSTRAALVRLMLLLFRCCVLLYVVVVAVAARSGETKTLQLTMRRSGWVFKPLRGFRIFFFCYKYPGAIHSLFCLRYYY